MFSSFNLEEEKNGRRTLRQLIRQAEMSDFCVNDDLDLFGTEVFQSSNDTSPPSPSEPKNSPTFSIDQVFDLQAVFNFQQQVQAVENQSRNEQSSQSFNFQENSPMMRSDSTEDNQKSQSPSRKNDPVFNNRKRRDRKQQNRGSCKKNIVGYIAKKSTKLVLTKYRSKVERDCLNANIQFGVLWNYYSEFVDVLYGPEKLAVMLKVSEKDDEKVKKMKGIFYKYFEKALRRDYMLSILKSGKMAEIQPYLCKKNSYLLYFRENI